MTKTDNRLAVVALISGRGSNLQSIIDQTLDGRLPIDLRAVVSNRRSALGLERARRAGIPTESLSHRDFASRERFDQSLARAIDRYEPHLVVLAGFMRILTDALVTHYQGRMMNIHPSLLPLFRGLHTHERALQSGMSEHGASVHFVTPELDGGPVIIQSKVPVLADDTPDSLAARVLEQEHRIYPTAIRWFAEGRLRMSGNRALLDGSPIDAPLTTTSA